ncbi:hypothetical protein TNCV_3890241 [Trichonephila clavipes]|nr:hypothetical protein TNCV_3890241 [Trichonephila clavipes]
METCGREIEFLKLNEIRERPGFRDLKLVSPDFEREHPRGGQKPPTFPSLPRTSRGNPLLKLDIRGRQRRRPLYPVDLAIMRDRDEQNKQIMNIPTETETSDATPSTSVLSKQSASGFEERKKHDGSGITEAINKQGDSPLPFNPVFKSLQKLTVLFMCIKAVLVELWRKEMVSPLRRKVAQTHVNARENARCNGYDREQHRLDYFLMTFVLLEMDDEVNKSLIKYHL